MVVEGRKEAQTVPFLVISWVLVAYPQFYFRVKVSFKVAFEERIYETLSLTKSWVFYWMLNLISKFKRWLWFNRTILFWDNSKVFAADMMCNLLFVYCKLFIFHNSKAYLGTFQTYMMDFFAKKCYCSCFTGCSNSPYNGCSYVDMAMWKLHLIIQKWGMHFRKMPSS